MTYTGQCNCGAVTISIDAQALGARQCWCRQCQKIAGGGPTNNAIFPVDAITITGQLAESSYTAASGNTLAHEFCPGCGTQIMGRSSARPQFRTIRMGVLDEGHGLRPTAAIWLEEAPDWAVIDSTMEQWPQQAPAPGASPST